MKPTARLTRASLRTALLMAALAIAPVALAQVDLLKQLGGSLLGGSASDSAAAGAALPTSEIAAGLKEALRVGSGRVVSQLGRSGGFSDDPAIRIPLPESMRKAQSLLGNFGMSGLFDDLELRLNRAAEAATPKARALFVDAISQMTLEDARRIYNGPEDAATRYFQEKMTPQLTAEMTPVVNESLSDVGAIASYDDAMARYRDLPLVPDLKADLSEHVVEKGLDGIFHYLAEEEAAIRSQPVARTTDLLKRVFGQ